tara:strand:+ start:23 stop:253 length:231 start_codon:yes stop_codon:yes gene_type:complete
VELDFSPQMEKTNVPNVDHPNLTVLRVTTHVAVAIATKFIFLTPLQLQNYTTLYISSRNVFKQYISVLYQWHFVYG